MHPRAAVQPVFPAHVGGGAVPAQYNRKSKHSLIPSDPTGVMREPLRKTNGRVGIGGMVAAKSRGPTAAREARGLSWDRAWGLVALAAGCWILRLAVPGAQPLGIVLVGGNLILCLIAPGYLLLRLLVPARVIQRHGTVWLVTALVLLISALVLMLVAWVFSLSHVRMTGPAAVSVLNACVIVGGATAIWRRAAHAPPTYTHPLDAIWPIVLAMLGAGLLLLLVAWPSLDSSPALALTNSRGQLTDYPGTGVRLGKHVWVTLTNPTGSPLSGTVWMTDNQHVVFRETIVVPAHRSWRRRLPIVFESPQSEQIARITFVGQDSHIIRTVKWQYGP
jgi:hypothetical protein